nr:MAG TPA: hypothetical protein [Bacteriophage sp.]
MIIQINYSTKDSKAAIKYRRFLFQIEFRIDIKTKI